MRPEKLKELEGLTNDQIYEYAVADVLANFPIAIPDKKVDVVGDDVKFTAFCEQVKEYIRTRLL